jgi:hypothetical protein
MPYLGQTERHTGILPQLLLHFGQGQIGLCGKPILHLRVHMHTNGGLASWLVGYAFGLTGVVALCGYLLGPTKADRESACQILQRTLALVIGVQKLAAQIIPIGFPHIITRRRVSPS